MTSCCNYSISSQPSTGSSISVVRTWRPPSTWTQQSWTTPCSRGRGLWVFRVRWHLKHRWRSSRQQQVSITISTSYILTTHKKFIGSLRSSAQRKWYKGLFLRILQKTLLYTDVWIKKTTCPCLIKKAAPLVHYVMNSKTTQEQFWTWNGSINVEHLMYSTSTCSVFFQSLWNMMSCVCAFSPGLPWTMSCMEWHPLLDSVFWFTHICNKYVKMSPIYDPQMLFIRLQCFVN